MFSDADHEVIDSPEALFRHLYEEHGVEEARELDPDTAPLQFWLRRADLERAERAARRPNQPRTLPSTAPAAAGARHPERAQPERPAGPAPQPVRAQPRRPGPTGAPAAAPGPSRRPGPGRGGGPRRRAGARGTAARRVRGPTGRGAGQRRWPGEATTRWPSGRPSARSPTPAGARPVRPRSGACSWNRCSSRWPSTSSAPPPARPARPSPPSAPAATTGPLPSRPSRGLGRPGWSRPAPPAPLDEQARSRATPPAPPAREEPVRPEAAWAVLWADLADTGRRSGDGAAAGGTTATT